MLIQTYAEAIASVSFQLVVWGALRLIPIPLIAMLFKHRLFSTGYWLETIRLLSRMLMDVLLIQLPS